MIKGTFFEDLYKCIDDLVYKISLVFSVQDVNTIIPKVRHNFHNLKSLLIFISRYSLTHQKLYYCGICNFLITINKTLLGFWISIL